MSDIKSLANSLLSLDNHLTSCMRCGTCQAVCPVYGQSTKEADVARGKIVLLQHLAYEMIKDVDAVEERLNRCLLCGSCQANCASGVQTMEIFMEGRKILTQYKGLPAIKKMIFRVLLPRPKLFAFFLKMGSLTQGIVVRKQNNVQNTATAPLLDKYLGKRQIPPLPKEQLSQKYADLKTSGAKYNVLFFPGCMTDKIYPRIGEALIKVLKHHNVGVTLPSNFSCCGMPTLASGDVETFQTLLHNNIDVFNNVGSLDNYDYILSACPSCEETMHKWWPHYGKDFDAKDKEKLESISKKVIDINSFLYDVLSLQEVSTESSSASKEKITYHDSCHLKKSLNVAKQPRALIKQNPKYELVEMADADKCCGCGGSFTLMHPELSKNIGTLKRDNIVATHATTVATGCPACMMQISDMLARNGDNVKVKHSIEIIAESL